jgi:hypothetical protein
VSQVPGAPGLDFETGEAKARLDFLHLFQIRMQNAHPLPEASAPSPAVAENYPPMAHTRKGRTKVSNPSSTGEAPLAEKRT